MKQTQNAVAAVGAEKHLRVRLPLTDGAFLPAGGTSSWLWGVLAPL